MKQLYGWMAGALLLVAATASPVFADVPPPPEPVPVTPGPSSGAEVSVFTEIGAMMDDLNGVGGVTILDQALHTLVFACPLGSDCDGGIVIEQAGLAGVNLMGIYDLSDPVGPAPTRVAIFVGADTASRDKGFKFDAGTAGPATIFIRDIDAAGAYVDTGVSFGSGTSFGVFIENGFNIFYSEDLRNSDLARHVLTFHTESGGAGATTAHPVAAHSFLFAFEDLPVGGAPGFGVGDFDYNDFIYHFQVLGIPTTEVIPEPSSMLLFGLGTVGAGLVRRRRKEQRA